MKKGLWLMLALTVSCSQGIKDPLGMKRTADQCVEQLFDDEKTDFGSYRVGMSRAAFDDAGNTTVIYHAVDEVIDSIPLCKNEGIYAEVSFRFFNAFLSDIDVHFFLIDQGQLTSVFNVVLESLRKKFGEPQMEQGIYSWQVERGNRIVQVYLNDDSIAFGKPVIHLLFFSEGKLSV